MNNMYEQYKLGRGGAVSRPFKDPNPNSVDNGLKTNAFDVANRGPAANIPSIQGKYQFLKAYNSTGDSVLGPANRVYIQANELETKRRLQNSQNVLGLVKRQITTNEKTNSGKSNVVSSQLNYTTDYWQIPKTISSLIPDVSSANLPWVLVGGLVIYLLLKR